MMRPKIAFEREKQYIALENDIHYIKSCCLQCNCFSDYCVLMQCGHILCRNCSCVSRHYRYCTGSSPTFMQKYNLYTERLVNAIFGLKFLSGSILLPTVAALMYYALNGNYCEKTHIVNMFVMLTIVWSHLIIAYILHFYVLTNGIKLLQVTIISILFHKFINMYLRRETLTFNLENELEECSSDICLISHMGSLDFALGAVLGYIIFRWFHMLFHMKLCIGYALDWPTIKQILHKLNRG